MTIEYSFRQPVLNDAERCFEIETSAYEGDEAATLEKIKTRITEYPQGFLILETGGKIVGFINSGCAFDVVMSDEAFKELIGHDPEAPNVVIMSVVVDPAEQGKGYAKLMMNRFIEAVDAEVALGTDVVEAWRRVFRIALQRDGRMCLCGALAATSHELAEEIRAEVKRFFERGIENLRQGGLERAAAIRVLSALEGAMLTATILDDQSVFEAGSSALVA